MKKIIPILISCSLIVLFYNLNAQESDHDVKAIAENIDYNYFLKSLEYLASDELEGRDVGSAGYDKAAQYVAEEFEKNGLLPFGDDGTYFQKITFTNPKINSSSVKFDFKSNNKTIGGNYGGNLTMVANDQYEKVDEQQNIVFVGYGNIVPKENINDYEGVDVKGKTVIAALGGPKDVKDKSVHDLFAKIDNAKSQGATGIILFYPSLGILQNTIFNRIHGLLKTRMLYFQDTTIHGEMLEIDMKLGAYVKRNLIKDILKLNGFSYRKEFKNAEKGINVSKELKSTLSYSFDVNIDIVECKNVVALLPGTDSILKDEYVLLSAHLDHLGIGKAVKGDSIYNGMWDNASGSAAVVCLSKEINNLPEAPKRSIIFTCLTAEEKGLLGSTYYARNNEVKNGKIVANINMDMIGNLFEFQDVIPLGYSHSNLSEAVDFATSAVNIQVDDNKQEENNYVERSDQISFIKTGIPALNIGSGYTALNPKMDGQKQTDKWMDKYYHSPQDDLNQEYSEKAFLTAIKINFLTLYYISDMMEEIKWNEESWLYKKYVQAEE